MDLQECLFYAPTESHWRRHIPRTYYLTRSLAPLMYMTGHVAYNKGHVPDFRNK